MPTKGTIHKWRHLYGTRMRGSNTCKFKIFSASFLLRVLHIKVQQPIYMLQWQKTFLRTASWSHIWGGLPFNDNLWLWEKRGKKKLPNCVTSFWMVPQTAGLIETPRGQAPFFFKPVKNHKFCIKYLFQSLKPLKMTFNFAIKCESLIPKVYGGLIFSTK